MADRHVTLYSKKGLLTKVEGVEGLAQHFGYEVDVLKQSLRDYNAAAKNGSDIFGRSVFPDYTIEETEDFYVGEVVPVIHYTMGGIAINVEGQVLDKDQKVISGLYAVGEASGGVHGDNRLAGNSLLECTLITTALSLVVMSVWLCLFVLGLPHPPRHFRRQQSLRPRHRRCGGFHSRNWIDIVPMVICGSLYMAKSMTLLSTCGNTQAQCRNLMLGHRRSNMSTDVLWRQMQVHVSCNDACGSQAIFDVGGQDGTVTFEAVHNKELLETMGFQPVGVLA
eukprot:symbB.v1.2.015405.t1/scaffold1149.1/size164316/8